MTRHGSISAASLFLIRSTNSSSRRSRPASEQKQSGSGPKRSASICSSGWAECRPQRRHWICPPSRPASRAFSRAASRRRDRLQVFYLHGQELFQLHPPLHPPHLLPAHPALLCLWTHFSIGILPWSFNSLGLPAIFSSTFARTQLSDPLIFSRRVRRCGSQVFQHSLQHASLPCLQIGGQHRSPAAALTSQSNVPALPASLGMHTRPRWLLQFGTMVHRHWHLSSWRSTSSLDARSLPPSICILRKRSPQRHHFVTSARSSTPSFGFSFLL